MTTPASRPTDESKCRMRTRLIHGRGRSMRWDYDHHVIPPITSSATFRLDSAERGARGFSDFSHQIAGDNTQVPIYVYDRLDEPTRGMLEENLAVAERGEMALCFASGMAAISATLGTLLNAGDHVIAHKVLYGCTYSLLTTALPRYDIHTSLVDLTQPEQVGAAANPRTRVLYFETPVNPDMTLIDMAAMRRVVDELNAERRDAERIRIVVDNTFATPVCQRPIELGADIVCLSLTKAIGGFGTDVGGAVVGPAGLYEPLIMYRKDFGASLSPKAAWNVFVYGLPSLTTRMVNYQKSAHHVARFLREHHRVAEVRYPGLECFPQFALAKRQMRDEHGHFAPGSMVYFVLKDADADGDVGARFVDWIAKNAYSITLAVSLGQVKTLIECPYSMTHAAMPDDVKRQRGVYPGACRLSVGLEDWHDIVADLSAALEQV